MSENIPALIQENQLKGFQNMTHYWLWVCCTMHPPKDIYSLKDLSVLHPRKEHSMKQRWIHQPFFFLCLVGSIPTPLKNMKVSWDDYSQYMWKKSKCSKPPTSVIGIINHSYSSTAIRLSAAIINICITKQNYPGKKTSPVCSCWESIATDDSMIPVEGTGFGYLPHLYYGLIWFYRDDNGIIKG